MRESQAVESARCALGAQLAAYRRAAGYSQEEFAALADYSRSTIANVETGRQRVPRRFWERAGAALHATGELLRANDEVETAVRRERAAAARAAREAREAQTRRWQPEHEESHAQQVHDNANRMNALAEAHMTAAPLLPCSEQDLRPAAMNISATAGLAALRWLVAPRDGSAERFDGWRPINPGDLARLHGVRHSLKDLDNAYGGGATLPMAISYVRREIPRLLKGRYDDATGRRLFEVTAEFQHDLGWMAYDAGQQKLASHYFAQALRFAHAAGNRLLGGRILAAMSHQAIYLDQIREAIDLARAARTGTRHLATPRAEAMLAAMEACAHAAAGDSKLCEAALGDAEAALADKHSVQQEPEWLDFDEGGYWGHAARAYRDLGQPRKAHRYGERAVVHCLPGHSRTRAQRRAITATALLRLGDAGAAAEMGETIVQDAWNLHSGHVFSEIADLAQAIEPLNVPAANGFLDQARELLAARAPAGAAATI